MLICGELIHNPSEMNPKSCLLYTSLIICNGYKDESYIELALLAQKMGKRIFLVVEKMNELKPVSYTHLDVYKRQAFIAEDKMVDRFTRCSNELRDATNKVAVRQALAHPCLLYTSRCV